MTIRHRLLLNTVLTFAFILLCYTTTFFAVSRYDDLQEGARIVEKDVEAWLKLNFQVSQYLNKGLSAISAGKKISEDDITPITDEIIHTFITLEKTRRLEAPYVPKSDQARQERQLLVARDQFGLIHANLEKAIFLLNRGRAEEAKKKILQTVRGSNLDRDFIEHIETTLKNKEIQAAQIDNACRQIKRGAITIGIILMIFSLGLSGFLMHRIRHSIQRSIARANAELLRGTQSVAAGDFDINVQTGTDDELSVVGEAFNKMSRDLKVAQRWRIERDAAESANKAKSVFLANMSHELRTPMHGILSYAKFGQQRIETASKEKLKTYFDEIHESGMRLMLLLNDILDLSKLEAGKTSYSMMREDLIHVVFSVSTELKAFAEEKGLKIELKHTASEISGVFDRIRITQVIRNLLSNAIKFSKVKTVILVELSQETDRIQCRIVNQGIGIPSAEIELIFDKFAQSSRTKTGAGGTGLGLAICKEIVQAHQGKIWAESDADGETRFIVEWPLNLQAKNYSVA